MISEIPKYLKTEHIEPIERKIWTVLKRRLLKSDNRFICRFWEEVSF